VRICLMIEGQEGVTWDEWIAVARAAEEAGLEALFRSDHYTGIVRDPGGALDAWTTLAALATVTSTLRLGTLVSPATFRHPSVLARIAVTVDHVSRGRVEVGMGAGWFEREHAENGFPFLDARERFDQFAEQVVVVVRSWTEDSFDHDGRRYTLRGQTALPKPIQLPHPPLVLGGRATPRAAALAARYAAEYNTLGAPLDELRERRARLDAACRAEGRDPATLAYSLMTTCVIGRNRSELDRRLQQVGDLTGSRPDPESEETLVGTVDQLRERLAALAEVGISRVMLQHLDHRDLDAVAAMSELR
jgi:F420-dependent oxidoreductase-like protein